MNRRVVDIAFEIERGVRSADPTNANDLIASFKEIGRS